MGKKLVRDVPGVLAGVREGEFAVHCVFLLKMREKLVRDVPGVLAGVREGEFAVHCVFLLKMREKLVRDGCTGCSLQI